MKQSKYLLSNPQTGLILTCKGLGVAETKALQSGKLLAVFPL